MESTIDLTTYCGIARRAELRDQELLRRKIEEKDMRQEAWEEYNENLGKEQFFGGRDER